MIQTKIKMIFDKIENILQTKSKIENSSQQNTCFDVLNNLLGGILIILNIKCVTLFWSVWQIWWEGDQIFYMKNQWPIALEYIIELKFENRRRFLENS